MSLVVIFGMARLIGGVFLFLTSFGIYGKSKVSKKSYIKVISVVLIISGVYDLVTRNNKRYEFSDSLRTEWTSDYKRTLISTCMRDTKETSIKYPKSTRNYCKCSTNEIMKKMTYSDYISNLKRPKKEQFSKIVPIIQSCIDKLQKDMKD